MKQISMTEQNATEKQENFSYALSTGTKGEQALAIQQKFMAENSYEQLRIAKLEPGMTVYDIGCGSGEMTIYLAQSVGETGCVYAVDASQEQLQLTKERIESLKLNNVRYILADIQTPSSWISEKADIVYSRLILMHLQNPKDALKNMYALLKPYGMLSLQETTWSTICCSFPCEAIDNYRDAVIALGKERGANYNLGEELPFICKGLGFKIVHQQDVQTKLKINIAKQLLLARVPELKSNLIEAKITTAKNFDSWIQVIENLSEKDDAMHINPANMMHILVEKN